MKRAKKRDTDEYKIKLLDSEAYDEFIEYYKQLLNSHYEMVR